MLQLTCDHTGCYSGKKTKASEANGWFEIKVEKKQNGLGGVIYVSRLADGEAVDPSALHGCSGYHAEQVAKDAVSELNINRPELKQDE